MKVNNQKYKKASKLNYEIIAFNNSIIIVRLILFKSMYLHTNSTAQRLKKI